MGLAAAGGGEESREKEREEEEVVALRVVGLKVAELWSLSFFFSFFFLFLFLFFFPCFRTSGTQGGRTACSMDECGEIASPAGVGGEQGARDGGTVRHDPAGSSRRLANATSHSERQWPDKFVKGPPEYCRIQRANLHYFLNLLKAFFKKFSSVLFAIVSGVVF